MNKFLKEIDTGSLVVMALTLFFFVLALFFKGLTHDILLEAGVFLVSVKLIIVTYKLSVTTKRIEEKSDKLLKILSDSTEKRH